MREKIFPALVIGILSLSTPASSEPPRIVQGSGAGTTFESYRQECIQRSRREGLASDIADDLCRCTIEKFQASYSLAQFRALVQKSKTDRAAALRLSAVGEACFDDILYEK
jgi:hypothetical protein